VQQSVDPWDIESERSAVAGGFRRPDLSAVPRGALYLLGALAALRAVGLVLVAEAIARGIGALSAGEFSLSAQQLVLGLALAGALLRGGAEWATSVTARRVSIGVKHRTRAELWKRIASDGSDAAFDADGGTAVLAADGLDALDDYFTQTIPAVISAAIVPLLLGLRILGADWVSAVIIVVTVPLVPLFMILIGKHTQLRTDAALGALTRLANHLTELAKGLPVLVGLGRVDEQTEALDGIQRRYRAQTEQSLRWAFLSALALELIATISVAVVAVFLGLRLLDRTMTLEPALIALILAPECFAALREVGAAFHASQDGLSAYERARRFLSREPRHDARRPGAGVRVSGLAVRYAGRTHAAFEPLTAELAGVTAVTGPSGSGKSTFLAALAGVLPQDAEVSGEITGVDPARVAWAPQSPRHFAATPREELALYGAAPEQALAELGLSQSIDAAIPELSPGELRRLAVARALARVDSGADLLLLDEPTAHLDPASAELVRAAIRRRSRHCVIVLASHEPETLAMAGHSIEVHEPMGAQDRGSPDARPTSQADLAGARNLDDAATPPEEARAPARGSADAPETPGGAGVCRVARGKEMAERLSLRALLRPQAWIWTASMLLAALAAGLGAALTAVSGWLIVRASVEDYIMYLLVAIVGVRAFGIGRAVGRYAERLVTHRAAFSATDALRLRLWRAIASRGAGSRRLLEGGAPLDYLVTLVNDLRDQLPRVLPPIGAGVLMMGGMILTTVFVLPQLAWLVTGVLVAAVAVAVILALAAERGAGAARVAERSAIMRGTASLAAAADDLRGNDVHEIALSRLNAAATGLAKSESRLSWSAGAGVAIITAALSALAGLVAVAAPHAPGELASVIALLSLALIEPLTGLVNAAHRVPALRALLARIGPALRPPLLPTWGDDEPDAPVAQLDVHRASIRYPGAAAPAVCGLSASTRRGTWLLLDGPSGSGKSTVLSAVMGSLALESGEIRANTVPITAFTEAAWRSRVVWCPQDAYVFDSTLRGNLLLARPRGDAPDEREMRAALVRAGLGELLHSLSAGLDTRIGPGGSALSGGERQRLAVARTLLARAEVILLDEPTAHLDAPTAADMMNDIREATTDRIVVLVSHRRADRRPEDVVVRLR